MHVTLPPGRYVEEGREYVFNACPACGRENRFYWNPTRQKGICWSAQCNLRVGSIESLKRVCGGLLEVRVPKDRALKKEGMKWIRPEMCPLSQSFEAKTYLSMKGLSIETAEECALRAHAYLPYVYAPLYTPDKTLPPAFMERSILSGGYGWIFRSERMENQKGFKGQYLFASPRFLFRPTMREYAVIVEGVGDLLKQPIVQEMGIAVCGATISPVLAEWLSHRCKRVIIWGDKDKGGQELYSRAKPILRGEGLRVRKFVHKESVKDPGDAHPRRSIEELLT